LDLTSNPKCNLVCNDPPLIGPVPHLIADEVHQCDGVEECAEVLSAPGRMLPIPYDRLLYASMLRTLKGTDTATCRGCVSDNHPSVISEMTNQSLKRSISDSVEVLATVASRPDSPHN
jgi:hypothetical protein